MKISGFTMAKNADKLYYPIRQAIESILPICDEVVVAIGKGDDDDKTREIVESIDSNKIKIIDTVWNLEKYPQGMENAHQTDIAKEACSGDWLFYVQADEVVHEDDLPKIKATCEKHLHDENVEGLLFDYYHFYGDYNHFHFSHGWYKKEIRIVRNHPDIHSWRSAQSFRKIPDFDGIHYRQKEGTYKLKVVPVDAHIYHYGWVRPPRLMKKKMKALSVIHHGENETNRIYNDIEFLYGPLQKIKKFKGTHPKVMTEWMKKFDWEDKLQYSGGYPKERMKMHHEKTKYRLVTWIENNLLGGRSLGSSKNYILYRRK